MPKSAPPKLAQIQREMLATIRRPLARGDRMQDVADGTAQRIIKPNDRMSSFDRLEVYNQQYWWRLTEAFADDFPGVRAVVGPKAFDRLAIAYLEACPSRSWNLRNLGSSFAQFLEDHPEAVAKACAPLAHDVAAVEWAATAAFDDPECEPIDPKQLAGADPATLRLDLQPYLQLLELRHPVDRLLAKLRKRTNDTSAASNAVGHRKARRAPRLASRPLREPLYLGVHRVDFSVYYKRLDALAYHLLRAIRAGSTLESACEIALAGTNLPAGEAALAVQRWFATFTSLGWLCPRKAK